MNNFKKLLASAMALTMVTSVLPAATTNVSAAACSIAVRDAADKLVDAIVTDITDAGYTLSNVPHNSGKAADGTDITWTNTKGYVDGIDTGSTLWSVIIGNVKNLEGASGTVSGTIANRVENCAGSSSNAEYLADFEAALRDLMNLKTDLNNAFETILFDGSIDRDEWSAAEALYNRVLFAEGYLSNQSDITTSEKSTFRRQAAELKQLVAEFQGDYVGDYAEVYEEALLKQKVAGTTVEDIMDVDVDFPRTNLTALETFIANVKANEHVFKDTEGNSISGLPSYTLVGNESEVVAIMDELETIVEEMKTVNDLMDSTSDVHKALRDVRSLVRELAAADNEDDDAPDYVLTVINKFNAGDIDNVVTYVEEFFNEFYTVDVRERSNGRYTAELEPTELERYLTSDEQTVLESSDIAKILTKFVDETSRTGDTYYDELVAAEGTTKDDLIAIAEEAADIELKFTYTDVEVETVYNALDALAELLPTEDGKYTNDNPYDLTARERRDLKSLDRYLSRVAARIENAEVIVTEEKDWWVYENGQWVFYQDGHTVSNRWVASNATDWYYAGANGVMLTNSWIARDSSLQVWYYVGADGKMVTNTVVDGCTIDANGEWHA